MVSRKSSHQEKSLFEIEKERRDQLFRDKNVSNFNITGEKSYEKKYPIKKIRKIYYNNVLSDENFMLDRLQRLEEDESLDLAPPTRKLNDVMEIQTGIIRVKADTMDRALK